MRSGQQGQERQTVASPHPKKMSKHTNDNLLPHKQLSYKSKTVTCVTRGQSVHQLRARSLVAFYTHLSARKCLLFICVFICLFNESEGHCSYCQHAVWSVVIIVHPVVTVSPRCTQVLSSSLPPLQMNQVQRAPGGKKRSQVTVWLAFFFLQSRLIKATVLAC